MSKGALATGGLILGGILGYPISYFFQAGVLRAKLSLGGYIQHIGDVLGDKNFNTTAIGTWIACAVIFAAVGWFIGKNRA